jgi:hypothetical protein
MPKTKKYSTVEDPAFLALPSAAIILDFGGLAFGFF